MVEWMQEGKNLQMVVLVRLSPLMHGTNRNRFREKGQTKDCCSAMHILRGMCEIRSKNGNP